MADGGPGEIKRAVKLTIHCSDGMTDGERDGAPFDGGPFDGAPFGDDLFDDVPRPIEDVEDAVIRRMEEEENEPEDGDYTLVTTAMFRSDGKTVTLTYDEAFSEEKDVKTIISFTADDPGSVVVMRTGEIKSTLVLEEGRTHISFYETQFFPFEVTVRSRKVVNTVSPVTGKGEMFFDYTVTLKGMVTRRTVMRIKSE